MSAPTAPLVLVAHGSRDPRAAAATRALAAAVAAARPGTDVHTSYLDHSLPRPDQVLSALDARGCPRAVVLPLLLTPAYHSRADVPGAIAAARAIGTTMPIDLADVLGPRTDAPVEPLLLRGLTRRLPTPGTLDAVVLAAAGTRDAAARAGVERVADALGATLGLPCTVAYASAAPPDAGTAVRRLRAAGAERVGVASYFLAPGLLYDAAMASGRDAGAVVTAEPLEDAPELAALLLARADAALGAAAVPQAA
ncbi:sirohydrochlorin ferrochelatase [Spirilliplanes yamanashiensis]|nr:sirohydrochlorin ferrochelatase [Spirilliplanes yamanashiensis]